MRGKPGTTVEVTIYRPETKKTFKVKITRALIHVTPVKWTMIEPYNIGYVRIVQFQSDTAEKLKTALEKILQHHPKGIILDLRNDPGGLLDQAVKVADLFLPANKVVVSIKGRVDNKVYKTENPPLVPKSVKLVILVNKGTASASEIVSGAMQDYKRAILVGTKTFGKFCVQTPIPIENGKYGVLKITTAYYYTPKGRNLNGKGLTPDVFVKMTNADWEKLEKAKEKIREEKGIPYRKAVIDLKLDKQLKTAVEIIEGTYKPKKEGEQNLKKGNY
jgi:carboxyl-terminal processing protease